MSDNLASWEQHWASCVETLRAMVPQQQFIKYISPLQADYVNNELVLFAPNSFVVEGVANEFLSTIKHQFAERHGGHAVIKLVVGSRASANNEVLTLKQGDRREQVSEPDELKGEYKFHKSNLNENFVFDRFIEGSPNVLAKAAAKQVAEAPGSKYNPLLIYGGVGLGKTHLMHAAGHLMLQHNPKARVIYLHSERFVSEMVKALQKNAIDAFKRFYRTADALLIDDIQFFAGKERSQEELFHTFNALLEGQQQLILTSDRFPKEINGIEERLKSRFGSGLTVAVEPPDLETRVAILINKAQQSGVTLEQEVAFFIAQRVRSNVRELEGALKRVVANAQFLGREISIEFVRDALKDLLAFQEKQISPDNIIKTVGEYYKIKVADLLSPRRTKSIAKPRQMAMALCKELTGLSLPEIGEFFDGRDHTTVLHACRAIKVLCDTKKEAAEDYANLLRILGI